MKNEKSPNKRAQHWRHGDAWTQTDDQMLLQLINVGMTSKQIAEHTGRTPGTIDWRVKELRRRIKAGKMQAPPTISPSLNDLPNDWAQMSKGDRMLYFMALGNDRLPGEYSPHEYGAEHSVEGAAGGDGYFVESDGRLVPAEPVVTRLFWGLIEFTRYKRKK